MCGGWRGVNDRKVHEKPLVLVPEDGKDDKVSPGICVDCKAAFMDALAQLQADAQVERKGAR